MSNIPNEVGDPYYLKGRLRESKEGTDEALILQFAFVLLAQAAFPQAARSNLPCPYSGDILQDKAGKPVRFTSNELKTRATRKVDVGNFMGTFDFHGTVVFEVLVSPGGKVVCLKAALGHPYALAEVGKAVQQWEFTPAKQNGKPVASLGVLEFYLCNISCGKEGISMSLLK